MYKDIRAAMKSILVVCAVPLHSRSCLFPHRPLSALRTFPRVQEPTIWTQDMPLRNPSFCKPTIFPMKRYEGGPASCTDMAGVRIRVAASTSNTIWCEWEIWSLVQTWIRPQYIPAERFFPSFLPVHTCGTRGKEGGPVFDSLCKRPTILTIARMTVYHTTSKDIIRV
jgi:hypothetical protein